MYEEKKKFNFEFSFKNVMLIALGFCLLLLLFTSGKLVEFVDNSEICVIQSVGGDVRVIHEAGPAWQGYGRVTHYKKSNQFWFSKPTEENKEDQSIKVRFNDGGHGTISGSVRWYMPNDNPSIIKIHTDYASEEAVEQQLVKQVLTKSIYMTGPLMSSKESSAEKRPALLSYIEDQAINGVFKTKQVDRKVVDELLSADGDDKNKKEKMVTIVEIQMNKSGVYERNEKSLINKYNITLEGLALNAIDYSEDVEKQIKLQQDLTMQVQTSIANAKKSIQDAITTEQKGKADAAAAKWAQEVIKAKLVTEAQQKKEVADLQAQTAIFDAKATRTYADAESYKNKQMVVAGLTPQEKQEYENARVIGVAKELKELSLPNTVIINGGSSNGNDGLLSTLIGANLAGQMIPSK